MNSAILSVKQFAAEVGYSEKTIRRKLDQGQIPGAYNLGDKGSHWKIPKDAVDKVKGKQ